MEVPVREDVDPPLEVRTPTHLTQGAWEGRGEEVGGGEVGRGT